MCLSATLWSQEDQEVEEVQQQVYEFLTQPPAIPDNASQLLVNAAWEALAYLDLSLDHTPADLQEAVPDYYNFQDSIVYIRLVDPANPGESEFRYQAIYTLADGLISLVKTQDAKAVSEWRIIAIDQHYLALDMGDVRVFFTHTSERE